MKIDEPGVYHIYNRGNNRQTIFFNHENYFYFLKKCHTYLSPYSDILAWCLMPNHFHFLMHLTEKSLTPVKSGGINMPAITNGFRLLQSTYAKGINKQQKRSGNLFQQKTKSKLVSGEEDYSIIAFHYIHQNPVMAKLVNRAEEWAYSSYSDYVSLRNGKLCNKDQAIILLDLSSIDLEIQTNSKIDEEKIKKIH